MAEMKIVEIPGWLAWLIAIPALVIAALFGFVVLLAVVGVVAILALYLGARIWWLRRKARRAPQSEIIEAEYVVVHERHARRPRE